MNINFNVQNCKNANYKNNAKLHIKTLQKKIIILLLIIITPIVLYGCNIDRNILNTQVAADYLRIHIRANSNEQKDQSIKYLIKDEVINYLTPYVVNCNSIEDVKNVVTTHRDRLIKYVNNLLKSNNFDYKSNIIINNEFFPTRSYDGVVLEANYYDAIIIELGQASGDNWWCVVYPPLCFLNSSTQNTQNIIYKSKIKELIDKFFK